MRRIALIVFCLLCGQQAGANDALDISLAHGSDLEAKTKAQLQKLLLDLDLSDWIFTKAIVIEGQVIPHSHPTLTLNTRHLDNDDLLLSTFLHEQLHWFMSGREHAVAEAENELRRKYAKLPLGFPEGSGDEDGNYEHLLIIYLEYKGDIALLGEKRAKQVMEFWATDHYTRLYRIVLDDFAQIGAIARKYGLDPRLGEHLSS